MALIEGWATFLLIGVLAAGASGLTQLPPSITIFGISLYAALLNGLALTLFIFAAGPASGGHLNPTITLATFFAGLCSLPRAVLYIAAQCTGAIIACYWLKLGVGEEYYFPSVRTACPDRRPRLC